MRMLRRPTIAGLALALACLSLNVSAGVSGFSSGRSGSSMSVSRPAPSYSPPPSRPAPSYTPPSRPAQPAPAAAPAPARQTSGWGSGTSTGSTVAKAAVGTTALGGALYAAQASKSAADTHAATETKAAESKNASASNATRTASAASTAPSHTQESTSTREVHREYHYSQPAQQVVVHDNSGGFLNNWLWYSMGRSSAEHAHRDTVVVNNVPAGTTTIQQGGTVTQVNTAPGQAAVSVAPQVVAPMGSNRYDSLSPEGQQRPVAAAEAEEESSSGIGWILLGLAGVAGLGFAIYKIVTLRNKRIAALTPKNHYSL